MSERKKKRPSGDWATNVARRDVTPNDLDAFVEQQRDAEANRMAAFTRGDPKDRAGFLSHWERILGDDAIVKKTVLADDQIVGHVACFERLGKQEVTYWIGKKSWGRGIATWALNALLELVTIRPIYARAASDNVASARVLEKCGFSVVGTERGFAAARGTEIDELIFELASAGGRAGCE